MKDYLVTITLSFSIQAKNEEQADERATMIQEAIKIETPKNKQWWPDMDDAQVEVEEQ